MNNEPRTRTVSVDDTLDAISASYPPAAAEHDERTSTTIAVEDVLAGIDAVLNAPLPPAPWHRALAADVDETTV